MELGRRKFGSGCNGCKGWKSDEIRKKSDGSRKKEEGRKTYILSLNASRILLLIKWICLGMKIKYLTIFIVIVGWARRARPKKTGGTPIPQIGVNYLIPDP
jgi:hypothetical protein